MAKCKNGSDAKRAHELLHSFVAYHKGMVTYLEIAYSVGLSTNTIARAFYSSEQISDDTAIRISTVLDITTI